MKKIRQVQFVEGLGIDSVWIKETQTLLILANLSTATILSIIKEYLP